MFTVADMLRLPVFAGHEIAAGKNGTGRRVRFVDFIEIPDPSGWCRPDTFSFTTGYAVRNNPEQICRIVRVLSAGRAAGLGVKLGRFISSIPPEAFRLADALDFPLVILPKRLAYAVVSRVVMREIFRSERSCRDDGGPLGLFQLEQDPVGLLEALRRQGWESSRNVWSLQWEKLPPQRPSLPPQRAFQYSANGSLRMLVAQLPGERTEHFVEFLKCHLPLQLEGQSLGISGPAPLENIARNFAEAKTALQLGAQLGFDEGVFVYSELELLDLLKKNRPLPELREAASRCLRPLFDEDAKKHSSLAQTLRVWFACDGSSEKAAQRLHIHRNTLLYRHKRIMELLPLNRYGSTPFRLALFFLYAKNGAGEES